MKRKCFFCGELKDAKDLEKNNSHSLKPSRVKYIWICKAKIACKIRQLEEEIKYLREMEKSK